MQSTKNDAAAVALQVLESIRTTHPALIADNMPADWGMNKLREALGQGKSVERASALAGNETTASSFTLCSLYAKWDQLADVPIDGDDAIEVPFLHFAKGTHREEIWQWFERQHPGFRVGEVQRGIRHVDTIHELYIKIAADTIALLRKVDVFRVIDSVRPDNIDGVSRSSLANWIKAKRPDLGTEVDEVMAELA